MKKFSLIISVLALVMGLSQCQKRPNMPTFNGSYAGVTKEITFTTGNGGSKATIDNSVLKELHYKWESTDVIHVYGSQTGDFDDGKYCGELKLVSDPGFEKGVFKGTLNNVPTTGKLRFYYFGGGDKDAVIDLSEQDGKIDNGAASLNKKIVACVEETITSGAEYDKTLEVLYSIIKFDFNQFGTCDLTMMGTKNTSFSIDGKGNMIETAGTTTTLKGVSAESKSYYVAVLPTDVAKLGFSGNGKVGSKTPTKPLEANNFYTDNGNSYEIEAKDAAESPTVETRVGCQSCVYGKGGYVKSTTTQECEYGVVYAKTSDVANPDDIAVGKSKCYKVKANIGDVTNIGVTYNVDIDLDENTEYGIKAYAIGENNTIVYGSAMIFNTGDGPQALPSGWISNNGTNTHPFTVNKGTDEVSTEDDVIVYFSQGNLQYVGGTTPYWQFANHQFDVLNTVTGQNSSSETVARDLFSWGTSGLENGAIVYQPWSISNVNADYNPYGGLDKNLYDETKKAEWGYNKIYNGGNTSDMWRTLTKAEWYCLFNRNPSLIGRGTVGNCTAGVILLPDDWVAPQKVPFTPGIDAAHGFNTNEYSYKQWSEMEAAGAVFLPAAGSRREDELFFVGTEGNYWASTYYDAEKADYLFFNSEQANPQGNNGRQYGFSVRLVRQPN